MTARKWAIKTVFGASLGLAGMLASGLLASSPALAQAAPSLQMQITSPATGASVSNPVTVTVTFVPLASSAGTTPPTKAHHHGGQAYLVVDSPAPAARSIVTADSDHIAFPKGQQQLSVTLPAGTHKLLVVAVNHKGKVLPRVQASTPITITVQ
jgi:uncharacterized cupredoxin-like copper-binding protein